MKPKSKKPAARAAKSKATSARPAKTKKGAGRTTKPKKARARATKPKKAGAPPEEIITSMARLLASYQEIAADDPPRGCCKVPNGSGMQCIPDMLEAECLGIAGATWTQGACPNPCDSGGSG